MTFSSFVTMIFSSFVKPFVALLLSFCTAISAIFTGPMGEYQKLQIKTLGFAPVHTGVEYDMSVNAGVIASLAGVDLKKEDEGKDLDIDSNGFTTYSGKFDIYADIGNAKFALTLGEAEKKHSVYLDATAFAATPELTAAVLESISAFKPEYIDAYKKHTSDYGFYMDFNEMFAEEFGNITQKEFNTTKEFFAALLEVYDIVFTAMGNSDNLKLLQDIVKKPIEISSKYYTETTLDGSKAYNFRMTGKEYVQLLGESSQMMTDEQFIQKYFALIDAVVNEKIVDKNELEAKKPEIAKEIAEEGARTKAYADAILTGEGIEELFGKEYASLISMCLPYIDKSYVSGTITEKDGAVVENYELCITDGTTVVLNLKYNTKAEKYNGKILSPAQAVPFGKRLTTEVLQNKTGFEKAITKGVNTIEISWNSEMTPASPLEISYPEFYLLYNSNNADYQHYLDYVNSPDLTEEEKNNLPKWPEGMEKREISGDLETSAQLLDGSVYLPLRQLMENAGYVVSWDDAARKAYVTVNGTKVEMTGVIVNNKTYVKVRDFEKLGAVVTYVEKFSRENAWNDFKKSCFATITFKTAE